MLLSGRLSAIFSAGLRGCGEGGGVGAHGISSALLSGVRGIFFGRAGASVSGAGRSGVAVRVHGILLRGGMGKLYVASLAGVDCLKETVFN